MNNGDISLLENTRFRCEEGKCEDSFFKVSTLSNKLFITFILSETLAPPRTATKGLSGFSIIPPKNSNSLCIKYPQTAVSTNLVSFQMMRSEKLLAMRI